MHSLRIRGGKPLSGCIRISGAKNAALPVLAAAVCFEDVCRIDNCPNLTDVDAAMEILAWLGAECTRRGSTVTVDPRPVFRREIPGALMEKMRGSVFFLGPLMARFGRARLTYPGGCPIGARPVDFHLKGLTAMGARVTDGPELSCRGPLTGGEVLLPYPSVGATENLILAALGAKEITVIHNAAREPEICCLCDFLRSGGCKITGDGTPTVSVLPGRPRSGHIALIPDRMEAATWLCAGACAGGSITLDGADPVPLAAVTDRLEAMGCRILKGFRAIRLEAGALFSPGEITTGPYPAFPTDAQAPMMAALLRAKGETVLRETVFSGRMHHVPFFRAMGGNIELTGNTARITGVEQLRGAAVEATDLRAGGALMAAALAAEGETEITGLKHLLRGYENIGGKLKALGAECSAV